MNQMYEFSTKKQMDCQKRKWKVVEFEKNSNNTKFYKNPEKFVKFKIVISS